MLSWLKQTFGMTPPPAAVLQQAGQAQMPTLTTNYPPQSSMQERPKLRSAKLIMVTANNNNKFYEMQEQSDGTFEVSYGRVGNKGTIRSYPMAQWDSKFNEKIRKGYTDQTHLFAVSQTDIDTVEIDDKVIQKLVHELLQYAQKSIRYNYNVTADQVTRKQVEEAQRVLDNLVARVKLGMRARYFNDKLLVLYQVIPRRMSNVKDYLIEHPKTAADIQKIRTLLAQEQATLDVMRGQVEIRERQQKQEEHQEQTPQPLNLLDAMGIQIELVQEQKLVRAIKKMMTGHTSQFVRAYKVCNLRTQTAFDKHLAISSNKKTALFWHGSRNENWLSILKTGLVLRPANAVITGKMFGYGLYFADKFQKSLNYTSLKGSYWANGTQNKAYLALYDVHIGNQMNIKKHESWCGQLTEDKLKQRGVRYNSVFAQGGADLINNEYIIYNQNQCTVRYLVEVK